MKTVVYVDGFNLYYGVLRGTTFKGLDLYALFQDHVLGPAARVEAIRYYTAPVKGSASDDPASPQRQRIYLSALKAFHDDRIAIVHGSIVRTTPILRLLKTLQGGAVSRVRVVQLTEKETDVNLAADLISDAWLKALSPTHLARAQLPERIPGTPLRCPDAWRACSGSPDQVRVPASAITELGEL